MYPDNRENKFPWPLSFTDNEHIYMELDQKLSKYCPKEWKREASKVGTSAFSSSPNIPAQSPGCERDLCWKNLLNCVTKLDLTRLLPRDP